MSEDIPIIPIVDPDTGKTDYVDMDQCNVRWCDESKLLDLSKRSVRDNVMNALRKVRGFEKYKSREEIEEEQKTN